MEVSVPILMYHDLDMIRRAPKYKHFYVLIRDFEWQMTSLHKAGYTPINFQALDLALSGQAQLPPRPIILTFDDGYLNVIKLAHPVLSQLQFPYTVFVVSGEVGGTNKWVSAEGYDTSPLMNWDDIRTIMRTGLADIQAHTVSHRRLTELPADTLIDELSNCKSAIEKSLDTVVTTICYPWGSCSEQVTAAAAAAGYRFGVTTEFGRVTQYDNPLTLPRISIHFVPTISFDYGIASMNFWWKVKSRADRRQRHY